MDYFGALTELYEERKRIDKVIQNLEALVKGGSPAPIARRGRKNMSESERQQVSDRMKSYWASRRDKNGE